jgi:hypothetical protein
MKDSVNAPTGHSRLPDSETWVMDIIEIILQFVPDSWYCPNGVAHKKDEDNISMVKSRLKSKKLSGYMKASQ